MKRSTSQLRYLRALDHEPATVWTPLADHLKQNKMNIILLQFRKYIIFILNTCYGDNISFDRFGFDASLNMAKDNPLIIWIIVSNNQFSRSSNIFAWFGNVGRWVVDILKHFFLCYIKEVLPLIKIFSYDNISCLHFRWKMFKDLVAEICINFLS